MLSSKLSKHGTGHGRQAHLTMLGRSVAIKLILLYACNVASLIQRALFPAWSLNFLLRSELPDSSKNRTVRTFAVELSSGLRGTLNVNWCHSCHEASLEQAVRVRVRGLVITVQLAPQEVLPEALGAWRGVDMTWFRSLWTWCRA